MSWAQIMIPFPIEMTKPEKSFLKTTSLKINTKEAKMAPTQTFRMAKTPKSKAKNEMNRTM
jgi:hypothetical protein